MSPIRVIVISSVRPEPTSGGQLNLYRHLCGGPDIELEVYGAEPIRLTKSVALRRLVERLKRTRLLCWEQDFRVWRDGRWLDGFLPKRIQPTARTLVLNIAHGDGFSAARRFARRHHLPLVSIFHDWWPDLSAAHPYMRRILEKQFRLLYDQSTVALCVSEGMRAALGPHQHSEVLYPIPGLHRAASSRSQAMEMTPKRGFKILYFGNLFHYGPMLGSALESLKNHSAIRLEVRGAKPNWPEAFREEMRDRGLWFEFAPVGEFAEWTASGDCYLVTMSFDPLLRRQMETSFPSKLVECVQFGKPLVIWGPEYCSAIQWARRENRALCVTDPDPSIFCRALEALVASPGQLRHFCIACEAAQTELNPERLQAQFMAALEAAIKPQIHTTIS